MLKPFSKYARLVLALSLVLPLASVPADARPSSSSFKSGFSSQRSSSPSYSSSKAGGVSAAKKSGGFGSFGAAAAKESGSSDSALSRKLDKERSEANALRTLDERRAAQAEGEAARKAPPAPNYGQPSGGYADDRRAPPAQGYGNGYGYGPAPVQPQPPIIVRQDSGLGHIVAGAILARSAANAHANNNYGNNGGYNPAAGGGFAGDLANKAGAGSVGASTGAAAGAAVPATPAAKDSGGSIFGTIVWLAVLALIGWVVYRLWKRAKARREANKPNYSFERN